MRNGRQRERVAICGLGLRTSGKGGIDSHEKFWNLLVDGEDASDFFSHVLPGILDLDNGP